MDDLAVLLPLRVSGGRPPLFCLHPGFALGWAYAGLLRHLGRDQPVYAIQARGLNTDEDLPKTYDELVEDYLRQIRTVWPHGPYRLLGWSFGGLVAYSLATRLQAAGSLVELLALLDTSMVGIDEMQIDPDEMPALIERETAAVRASMPDERRLTEIVANIIELRDQFVPDRYAGDVLLVTADQEPGRTVPLSDSWRSWVDGVIHDHHVDCLHLDLLNARNGRVVGRLVADALSGVPGQEIGR